MKYQSVLCCMAMIAVAASCSGSPIPISDSLMVFDSHENIVGQVIVDEAGNVSGLNSACLGPACGSVEDPANLYYIDDVTLPDPSQFGNPLLLSEGGGTLSDFVGVADLGGGNFRFAFLSNLETSGLGVGQTPIPEGNGIFDVTGYLSPGLRDAGFTATFISATPEPGSWALLTVGLSAVALGRFRRSLI